MTVTIHVSVYYSVKADSLQQDIAVMKETFQRKVDCKNALIHSLAEDIKEAEEQYRVALRRHVVKLDEMVRFQQKRVKAAGQKFWL